MTWLRNDEKWEAVFFVYTKRKGKIVPELWSREDFRAKKRFKGSFTWPEERARDGDCLSFRRLVRHERHWDLARIAERYPREKRPKMKTNKR